MSKNFAVIMQFGSHVNSDCVQKSHQNVQRVKYQSRAWWDYPEEAQNLGL